MKVTAGDDGNEMCFLQRSDWTLVDYRIMYLPVCIKNPYFLSEMVPVSVYMLQCYSAYFALDAVIENLKNFSFI